MTAIVHTPATAAVESNELITFRLGEMLFGIDILLVKEINCNLQHSPVPYAGGNVCGVINLRGEVLTVIDLARLLGLPAVAYEGPARYVIVTSGMERIALLVEAIEDVLTFDQADLRPVPANLRSVRRDAIRGIYPLADELLVVLDVDGALN